jgi:hypothetical protein
LCAGGISQWQATERPRRLIWEAGTDVPFWISVAATSILAVAAVWAYGRLARVARAENPPALGVGQPKPLLTVV